MTTASQVNAKPVSPAQADTSFLHLTYSIGVRFAGGGIGNIAYHDVASLLENDVAVSLLCDSSTHHDLPLPQAEFGLPGRVLRRVAASDPTGRVNHVHTRIYGRWASRRIDDSDLILTWGNYGLESLKQAKRLGIPAIVQWASSHPTHRKKVLSEAYQQIGSMFRWPQQAYDRTLAELTLADYVLVPSQFVRDTFLQVGFSAEKLITIPFGVDANRFHPASEPDLARPFRLLFVGQIGVRKGVLTLLEAWRNLNWDDAELWLVGRVQPDSEALLRSYRNLHGVRWIGHVADPVTMYQSADIFVFPTLEEGSALVTYEAMAAGLPLVTTAEAGSLVQDGQEGFIVPSQNVAALTQALTKLREDDSQRLTMGAQARTTVLSYTWSARGVTLAKHLTNIVT